MSDDVSTDATARPPRPLFSTTAFARRHARKTQLAARPPVDPASIRGLGDERAHCSRRSLLWTSALLLGATLLQRPGDIVPETKLDVSVDALTFLSRIWHLWEPAADMGHVQNQAVGYLFPMGPFFLVGQWLHVPDWILQRGWMALILVVAFWGTARLADELDIGTPGARLLGALAYALSPFFIARVGVTSAFVLGGAMLPWIILPLVRASRVGSMRRGAAWSGLAIVAIGGINGAVTLSVLVMPLVWLLTRERGRRRARLLAWWLVAIVLATAWWVVPLVFQLRYGFNFLPYTERAATTTAYTSVTETVRGTADWLSYLHLREGWLPAGWQLAAEPAAMVGSILLAAAGLFGLTRRDLKHRSFLLWSFLVGVAIVGAGYGGVLGDPIAGTVRTLLDGPLGMFRNVYKFQPVIALPLAFGAMHTFDVALRWSDSSVRTWMAARPRVRRVAPTAAVCLVLLTALPLLTGNLVSGRGFDDVPEWWTEVERAQEEIIQPGRALILPGTPAGDYTWGRTLDEPLQTTTDSPWALRSLIPLGGPGSTRVLDAVELTIERGGDTALIPYLQRAGISYVIARNDVNWRDWNAPRPIQVHRALLASGLTPSRSFGPNLPLDRDTSEPGFAVDGAEHELHAIELYEVGSPTIVRSYPARTAAVLSGGPEAGLALARAGLDDRAMILPGDVPADQPAPDTWVVTDTLRRRYVEYGLMRSNYSYTLEAGEPSPNGEPLRTQLLPTDGEQHQTVAQLDGVARVTASSYGSWLYQIPEAAPFNALDGDGTTAWVAGPTHSSVDEWWRTDLDQRVDLSTIQVQLLQDGSWRPQVTALEISTEAGSARVPVDPNETLQTVRTPAGPTRWVKIAIAAVAGEDEHSAGAGLREVIIPGVTMHRELVVPDDMASTFDSPKAQTPIYVFERATSDPRSLLRRDEEVALNRAFTVPKQADVAITATATAVPGDPLFAVLHDAADREASNDPSRLQIAASSTLSDLPEYDPRQLLDGRDDTVWAALPPDAPRVPPPLAPGRDAPTEVGPDPRLEPAAPAPQQVDPHPTIHLSWEGARTLDAVTVTGAPGFSMPRTLKLMSSAGERTASIGTDGRAHFDPITTTAIEVSFPDVSTQVTRNPLDGSLSPLPIGLASLRFPALADLTPPAIDPNRKIHIDCFDGPTLTIDGVTHRFSLDTTSAGIASLDPLPLHDCGPDEPVREGAANPSSEATSPSATPVLTLTGGVHHLSTARGRSPFLITTLVLQDPELPAPPNGGTAPEQHLASSSSRSVRMLDWGKEHRELVIDPGSAAYVAIDENFSSGWHARLGGDELPAVRLDGWRQGFVVPAGRGGIITLDFAPAAPYRAALLAGFALVLVLLALALAPVRQLARPRRVDDATIPWWLTALLVLGLAVVVSGPGVLALVPITWWSQRHRDRAPWIAAGAFVLAGVFVVGGTGHGPNDHLGAFGLPAQLLGIIAVLTVGASLVEVPASILARAWAGVHGLFVVPDEDGGAEPVIDLREAPPVAVPQDQTERADQPAALPHRTREPVGTADGAQADRLFRFGPRVYERQRADGPAGGSHQKRGTVARPVERPTTGPVNGPPSWTRFDD